MSGGPERPKWDIFVLQIEREEEKRDYGLRKS